METELQRVPVLVITGPVGAGKTTVVAAVSDLLDERGVPHAAVDQDWLRCGRPCPDDDRFNMALGLRNLAAVWRNFAEAGARFLVIADVVESRSQLQDYRTAIPGGDVMVVRLSARPDALRARLLSRESGSSLAWHLARAEELAAIMERERLGDLVVDTDGRAPEEIAREILERVGWLVR